MKILYKVWLFFMDSKKEEEKYIKKCNENVEDGDWVTPTLITFHPYPGRFKWRRWKIFEAYHQWRWKIIYKKINMDVLNMLRLQPSITRETKINGEYPMLSPHKVYITPTTIIDYEFTPPKCPEIDKRIL